MKIVHRVPPQAFRSAVLDPAYEAEVEAATQRGQAAYEKALRHALRAAENAERRMAKRSKQTDTGRDRAALRLARELYAERMRELEILQALAQTHGAPARNRGTRSFWPVPTEPKAF